VKLQCRKGVISATVRCHLPVAVAFYQTEPETPEPRDRLIWFDVGNGTEL
jgi:hypothetical protein